MTPLPDNDPVEASDALDLSLCAKEPIHSPGAIQPHGCMILCAMTTWTVSGVSQNCGDFLMREPNQVLGAALDEILPARTVHDLRNVLQSAMVAGGAERLSGARIDAGEASYDIVIHASGATAIIEILRRSPRGSSAADPLALVKTMIGRTKRAPSLGRCLQTATSQIRAVTGFDRVMVYQFLEDQTGKVVAESIRSGMTPFLGLHFPATDIPAQARALYRRLWLRLIPDTAYKPVPLVLASGGPGDVDLSLAVLRSVSPVHLEYLHNMGSRATLTISLLDGDKLWGLIACHHETPRELSAATCAATELFGQIFSLQIEAKVQAETAASAARAREIHDKLLASMSLDETMFDNLGRFADTLRELIPCDGLGVYSEKGYVAIGQTPSSADMDRLRDVLDARPGTEAYIEEELGRVFDDAPSFPAVAAGLVAIPFPRTPRNYLMFFRREVVHTVTWGGDPDKAMEPGRDGRRLGPRKSFEAWKQTVHGRSVPWTRTEVQTAETLRVSLLDVILRRSDVLLRERQIAQERQTFLIAELNHRVKNILALIRSLVRQTRAGAASGESFADDLEHRISSLALAHDQLTAAGWRHTPLRRLLEAEVRAWAHAPNRIAFEGPPVTLSSRAIQSLALVFHELVTNAAKHGSLSHSQGRLRVTWSRVDGDDLRIAWSELDGPPVSPPTRRGFGSAVVEQVVPFELGGEASLDYRPEGLCARFDIPAAHIGTEEAEPDPPLVDLSLHAWPFKRLLLVEDSMMIALDAQAMLQEDGLVVDVAGTLLDARRLVDAETFDAVVLDINLSGDTSFSVAEHLVQRRIPFVFATGYGESTLMPEGFRDLPVVSKPYDKSALKSALSTAAAKVAAAGPA